jgi:isopentenyl-diphosphate delta-isomerase
LESLKIMDLSDKAKPTLARKNQHLRIVVDNDVIHAGSTLLEDVQILHQALPELDLDEIDLSTEFFGRKLKAPLMITSMTGGADYAEKMNRGLAEVAEQHGIAFAVGSQRAMLRHPEVTGHFAVRKSIPNGVLLGNIGAVQLEEYSVNVIADLVNQIEADGICVHLNPAQELMQSEGHRHFRGLAERIGQLVKRLDGRVLVKETGAGMSPDTLKLLAKAGVTRVDVAGAGGTSWTKVESYRAQAGFLRQVGETFADWGLPTACSIVSARRILSAGTCLIGSGGIQSGLDCARAIALGADIAGFARPILLAFMENNTEGASAYIERIIYELKTAMLLTGSKNIQALQNTPRIYTGRLRKWLMDLQDIQGDRK